LAIDRSSSLAVQTGGFRLEKVKEHGRGDAGRFKCVCSKNFAQEERGVELYAEGGSEKREKWVNWRSLEGGGKWGDQEKEENVKMGQDGQET